MAMKKKLIVMVSSTVYGIEELLERICAIMILIGYKVHRTLCGERQPLGRCWWKVRCHEPTRTVFRHLCNLFRIVRGDVSGLLSVQQRPPRLSTMRTLAGFFFVQRIHAPRVGVI